MDPQLPPAAPAEPTPPAAPAAIAPSAPSWQGPAEASGPAPGVEFAGFGARLVAYLVDGFITFVGFLVVTIVLGAVIGGTSSNGEASAAAVASAFIWIVAAIVISVVYFPYFWQKSGQTPGMKLLNIRVVRDSDGGPVSWGSAILRYIGYLLNGIIFGLPIGWLWALIDKRRRGWHDLIGGTVVIRA